MKKFKVEHTLTEKKYRSVVVVAKDREEAISLARQMDKDHFEDSEEMTAHEWKASSGWSFSLILKSLLG
jgi:hypothetical protein